MASTRHTINTLEELQLRKDELQEEISKQSDEIGKLWNDLFTEKKDSSKGEIIAGIINKSIMAFDAFMLVRKLMKQYGNIFGKKK